MALNSPTRDRTCTLCCRSVESWPLDRQASPKMLIINSHFQITDERAAAGSVTVSSYLPSYVMSLLWQWQSLLSHFSSSRAVTLFSLYARFINPLLSPASPASIVGPRTRTIWSIWSTVVSMRTLDRTGHWADLITQQSPEVTGRKGPPTFSSTYAYVLWLGFFCPCARVRENTTHTYKIQNPPRDEENRDWGQ